MAEVEFIPNYTSRGKPAAIHDGFAYIKDKNLANGNERYKCMHAPKCTGFIWIKNNTVVNFKDYSHIVEPDEIKARKRMTVLRELPKVQTQTFLI